MKTKKYVLLLSVVLIFVTVFTVFAESYDLSPGLAVIKSKAEVKKCTVKNTSVSFSASDFESVLGSLEYVTVLTLPDTKAGKLMLGSSEIKEGQTLSKRSISGLRFEPRTNTVSTTSFTFCNPQKSPSDFGVCTIFTLEKMNLAPKVSASSFETSKNITCKGYLSAEDLENDELSFSVAASPKHGNLKLVDAKNGLFMYTPKTDFTGRDTFSFRVTDSFGNRSEACRVIIHINEPPTDTVFYDMTNHWAHNSAIEVFSDRVMTAQSFDGKLMFSPDEKVTRGDFLAVAMIAAGLENEVERVYSTPFLDDTKIPLNIKSYAKAAHTMGIIKGYPEKGGVSFKSNEIITRRDAKVILERIVSYCASSGNASLAVSSQGSSDLSSLGILVGVGKGEMASAEPVTKAQLAQIYCNLKKLRS